MAEGQERAGWRRRAALISVGMALVIDILDLTIVNVAIPTLKSGFGASDTEVQWLVAGYAALFAAFLVTGGRLGDLFGPRRLFVGGLLLFSLASAACGFAPDPVWLVIGRLVQGLAAALVVPQINAVVQRLYAPHERVSALAIFGVLGGAAAVSGPILGGLLIGLNLWGLGWRVIFLVNLPVSLLAMGGALIFVPRLTARTRVRPDWRGILLVSLTMSAALVPLVQGRAWGWPWWCFAMLLATMPLGIVTWRHADHQRKAGGHALIVLDLFEERSFRLGLALLAACQCAVASFLFVLTMLLQAGLGYSPMEAGLAHVPFALGASAAIGLLVGRWVPRFRARLLSLGAIAMAAGLLCIALLDRLVPAPGALALAPPLLLTGVGMGLLSGPLAPIALSEIRLEHAGAASGMLKSAQELGGAHRHCGDRIALLRARWRRRWSRDATRLRANRRRPGRSAPARRPRSERVARRSAGVRRWPARRRLILHRGRAVTGGRQKSSSRCRSER